MPAQMSKLEVMDEDQIIEEVLDKFVNCHEQTYEEFLNTFTRLSKEDNVPKRGAFGTNSSENKFTSIHLACENEANDSRPGNRALFLRPSSPCSEEEQIVLDEGQAVGSCFQGDLSRAEKAKVDNFLEMEDLDTDEEIKSQTSKDSLLLPGEAEQDVSSRGPFGIRPVARLLSPAAQPRPSVKGADTQRDEILGDDEVRPFRLDEEFDYDAVVLTPKFTPAETEAIHALSKQKQGGTRTDSEGPCD